MATELTLELTAAERALFDDMLAAAAAMPAPVVLRAAGGWVRDKLLGRPNNADIDVAVDGCSGRAFAEAFAHGARVAVIRCNPAQSKHLETATLRAHGIDVDVSALRTDDYTDCSSSRIPRVRRATAAEDAARRDLTINALFYRLDTGAVEDHTGRGVADLRAGVVRTPLEPRVTFTDDPLRVLRSVRFAARLGFACDPQLLAAAAHPDVAAALRAKISRERVGKELALVLGGPRVAFALQTLAQLGLWDAVFALPADVAQSWDAAAVREALALGVRMEQRLDAAGVADHDWRRWMLLAALLYPLRGLEHVGHKNRRVPAASAVLLDALKYSNHDVATVALLTSSAHELAAEGVVAWDRARLGMAVRRAAGEWRRALLLAAVVADDAERFAQVEAAILALGLADAHTLRPVFTGQELGSMLGAAPGPWVSRALERELEWQLGHPEASRDECQAWVAANASSLLS